MPYRRGGKWRVVVACQVTAIGCYPQLAQLVLESGRMHNPTPFGIWFDHSPRLPNRKSGWLIIASRKRKHCDKADKDNGPGHPDIASERMM
jgi:hypothetical protein